MGATTSTGVFIADERILTLLIVIVVLLFAYLFNRKSEGIPPGPMFKLPSVGDFPPLVGGDVIGTFGKLRQKHGDVFSLYLGKDLNIVLNGYKVIHEAAVTNGNVFSGRPSVLANDATGGKLGINVAEGNLWKSQRQFTHACLQEFGFGKASFEIKILKEVECFISVLKEKDGWPTDIKNYIHACVANVVSSIVCGQRHGFDDIQFQQHINDFETVAKHVFKVSIWLSIAPFLKYVPGDPLCMNVLKNDHLKRMAYYRDIYEEHVRNLDDKKPKDFFDMFILEMSKGNNPNFTVDQLFMIARDLFGAGIESAATTIRWAVLYLLKYEDIKIKLQSEIDSIIPDNRFPCFTPVPEGVSVNMRGPEKFVP